MAVAVGPERVDLLGDLVISLVRPSTSSTEGARSR
jgi:hypothetical protein